MTIENIIRGLENDTLRELAIKAYEQGFLEGGEFSIAIHELFITYPIIDTGNWENVNAELLLHLIEAGYYHPRSLRKLKH